MRERSQQSVISIKQKKEKTKGLPSVIKIESCRARLSLDSSLLEKKPKCKTSRSKSLTLQPSPALRLFTPKKKGPSGSSPKKKISLRSKYSLPSPKDKISKYGKKSPLSSPKGKVSRFSGSPRCSGSPRVSHSGTCNILHSRSPRTGKCISCEAVARSSPRIDTGRNRVLKLTRPQSHSHSHSYSHPQQSPKQMSQKLRNFSFSISRSRSRSPRRPPNCAKLCSEHNRNQSGSYSDSEDKSIIFSLPESYDRVKTEKKKKTKRRKRAFSVPKRSPSNGLCTESDHNLRSTRSAGATVFISNHKKDIE